MKVKWREGKEINKLCDFYSEQIFTHTFAFLFNANQSAKVHLLYNYHHFTQSIFNGGSGSSANSDGVQFN